MSAVLPHRQPVPRAGPLAHNARIGRHSSPAMHFLEQAAVFLLTAVLLVPLFQRLKLGAVLGYLGAGMLIGPWGLGMIGDVQATMQFAEFGVVLLLFLVGLELQPSRLWVLRRPVFGLGGAQVALTGAALFTLALTFGLSWRASLVAGFGLAMSSTALVLASLAEIHRVGELGTLDVPRSAQAIARSLRLAARNARQLGERYLVVRYEDLVGDPRKEIERVRRFIAIAAHELLAKREEPRRERHACHAAQRHDAGQAAAREAVADPPLQLARAQAQAIPGARFAGR